MLTSTGWLIQWEGGRGLASISSSGMLFMMSVNRLRSLVFRVNMAELKHRKSVS